MLSEAEKERLSLEATNFAEQEGALFDFAGMIESARSNGIIKELDLQRTTWAKDHGAQFVCT